jgi:glycolate oxidase subunit GlcD
MQEIADRLRAIVGPRYVLTRDAVLLVYTADGLPGYHKKPRLAVFPGSREEVVAVMQFLADEGIPFVPRGAGTGLSGGALADDVVLLGLHRLKRIVSVNDAERIAVVEPGVVNAALNRVLAPRGLFYAPDPSSETACTIGGNVAENSGGPHCLKYGVTLNHVAAATVILPDGEIVTLGDTSGRMAGYDLLGAFIGSEGCFGVAVEIAVRLTRTPAAVRTVLADFLSVDDAARATSAIVASGIVPAALEFMDGPMIRAVEASVYAAGYPADAAAVLLIEVDGTTESVEQEIAVVRDVCSAHGARTVHLARNDAERSRLWLGRKKAFGAMGRIAPSMVLQDAVIPRTKLPEILDYVRQVGERYGVMICNVFHAGDGNLHPIVAYDHRDPDETARVYRAMSDIVHACIAAGGSITGEHGVGLDKLGYMTDAFTSDTLTAMCDLRDAFDPNRRANPGKAVPVHSCREWHGTSKARA